jgi:Bacterial protein of unknown function (DUF899)
MRSTAKENPVAPVEYNFQTMDDQNEQSAEVPGRSSFLREGDSVFHTYSVYARGLETVGGSYYLHQGAFMMGPSSGTERRTTAVVANRITVPTRNESAAASTGPPTTWRSWRTASARLSLRRGPLVARVSTSYSSHSSLH